MPEWFRSSAYSTYRTPDGQPASHACMDERMDGWSHWGEMKWRNGDREGGIRKERKSRNGVETERKVLRKEKKEEIKGKS